MAQISLQSIQILSTVSHETFTSLGGRPAVVNVGETFTVSAVVANSGPPTLRRISVSLPAGYNVTGPTQKLQSVDLLQGETIASWEVAAPSKPDQNVKQITVNVRDGGSPLSIEVIAGPNQLVFTTPAFTNVVVGQPSPIITVQTQNATKDPQSPAAPTSVKLASSSNPGGAFFSDPACTQDIQSVTISPPADSASFYYQDTNAGTPQIKASDISKRPDSLGSVDQTEKINKSSTQTLVACSTPNPTVGQLVTLTATVTPVPPGPGSPTGQVQFFDGASAIGTVTLVQSSASIAPTTLSAGTHMITAAYQSDPNFIKSISPAVAVVVSAATVQITGKILTAAGHQPIAGVAVVAKNSSGKSLHTNPTDSQGAYSVTVPPGDCVQILFPPSWPPPNVVGQTLFLKLPGSIYVAQASPNTKLQDIYYELRTCQVSGTVLQMVGTSRQPLSGVQISLADPLQPTTVDTTTTDAQGNFCFNSTTGATNFVLQIQPTVTVGEDILVLSPNTLGVSATQTNITLTHDVPTVLPPFIYTPQLSTVIGQVTDGKNGLVGILVELSVQGGIRSTPTDQTGVYTFASLPTGSVELRFQTPSTDAGGTVWELQAGQQGTQSLSIRAGQVVQAATVAYQQEQHSVEQLVLVNGRPADNVLVDVRKAGAHYAAQSQRTGKDGKVIFVLPQGGQYEVRVYPDPSASGGPQVNVIEVHSHAVSPTVSLPSPGGSVGGPTQNGERAAIDLQAYPVLTEEMPAGIIPATTRPGTAGTVGGTSALGQAADKAIREVLSWRTKSDDAKGFLIALDQAFDLKEVEGHTEWTWTPRSYTVQTDMGAVTGAQASIYTRAKVALDQSLPLLDGLYPLVPNVEAEDLATVQSVVRTQFTALVNEFGTVGGPRVSRVDELFELLLGHEDPDQPPTKPEEIVKGSLGLVRQRFGLQRRYVTTVDDEQNLTNYLILVDYVIGLNHSWIHDKNYFIRNGIKPGFAPFFGTQLVLLSRALDVVAEGVHDAYFAMDSVFMGDAERQVAQLNFAGLIVKVPDPKTGAVDLHTFGPNTSGLFVAELLDWVDRAASDELPRLLQDAGKDGLESLQRVTDRLRKFVHGAIAPPQNAPGLPPGYFTPRVKRAMQLLADGLDETYKLAVELRPPDLPLGISPDDLRRLIREEISRASGKA